MSKRVDRSLRVLSKCAFATIDLFLGDWPGPRILIYHQITDGPTREMDLPPSAFARHVQWMADRGRFVHLEDALVDPEHAGAGRDYVLTFDDGYVGLHEHAYPILRRYGVPFTLYVTSRLVDDPSRDQTDTLNWDQINEMRDSGLLTIGAHTHTHPDLRELTHDQIEQEVAISNELIERHTGVQPKHFAYTKGYWAETAEPIVRRSYDTAVLGAGPPITGQTDQYRLSRVAVQCSDGQFFFRRKMVRGMRVEEWARSRVKGYRNPSPRRGSVSSGLE